MFLSQNLFIVVEVHTVTFKEWYPVIMVVENTHFFSTSLFFQWWTRDINCGITWMQIFTFLIFILFFCRRKLYPVKVRKIICWSIVFLRVGIGNYALPVIESWNYQSQGNFWLKMRRKMSVFFSGIYWLMVRGILGMLLRRFLGERY